jgi:hypothetical protein
MWRYASILSSNIVKYSETNSWIIDLQLALLNITLPQLRLPRYCGDDGITCSIGYSANAKVLPSLPCGHVIKQHEDLAFYIISIP